MQCLILLQWFVKEFGKARKGPNSASHIDLDQATLKEKWEVSCRAGRCTGPNWRLASSGWGPGWRGSHTNFFFSTQAAKMPPTSGQPKQTTKLVESKTPVPPGKQTNKDSPSNKGLCYLMYFMTITYPSLQLMTT